MPRLSLACLLLCMLAGCSLLAPRQPYIAVEDGPLSGSQSYLLNWQHQGQPRQSLLVLEHQPQQVILVALNSAGMTQFKLQRGPQGEQLEKSHFADPALDASGLLDILLLLNYPLELLQRQLGGGWQLLEQEGLRQWFYLQELRGSAQYGQDQHGLEVIRVSAGQDFQLRLLQHTEH